MAYRCLDCSNQSTRKFPAGRCPACGSYNIKSAHTALVYEKEKPKKTVFGVVLMGLLWGLLLFGIWDRYFR
jgi:predicted ATP-dependent serine protease